MSFELEAQDGITGVWKAKEIGFSYRSGIAIYSCGALQSRVASILRAVGARDDVHVRVDPCNDFFFPPDDPVNPWRPPSQRYLDRRSAREQYVQVRVRLMMPTEVTPDILAEIDKDRSRRELVSRVTGKPEEEPAMFPVERQSVTLSRRTIDLEPEDCELVEQMSMSVFPRLDIRVVRRSFSCDRNSVTHIAPQLIVETLMPVAPGTAAPPTPAAPEAAGDQASDQAGDQSAPETDDSPASDSESPKAPEPKAPE